MEQLINKKYKILHPSEIKLKRYGFRKIRSIDEEENMWKYSFPVYKYKHRIPTIGCIITVLLPSGEIKLDVLSNGSLYGPFYNKEYGNHEKIMKIINSNILHELSKLGAKERR